jgi:adenosylhomocysteine nucleosidase
MSTLICFALKEEAAPFRKIAAGMVASAQADISILITGIGRQNTEKSACEFFATHSPELVLTCGFAGGLNPELKLGEVVFEILSSSSRREPAQTETRNQSEPIYIGCHDKLIAAGAKPAKFFFADRIATTVAEKKKLRDETGADAVEMESAAIYAVCRERGIPCATVRVISDTASEDLPLDFNALATPDKSLDFGKLFLAIAKSPGKIGALMQLQKKTRFAAEQLADVLAKIILP